MTTIEQPDELARELERVLFRRCLEKRIEGYTLETAAELAQVALRNRAAAPDKVVGLLRRASDKINQLTGDVGSEDNHLADEIDAALQEIDHAE